MDVQALAARIAARTGSTRDKRNAQSRGVNKSRVGTYQLTRLEHKPYAGVLVELEKSQGKNAAKAEAQKVAMERLVEHNSCPITHELMVDPVLALDGQVYERWAIQKWFDKHKRQWGPAPFKSPVTQKGMQGSLVPLPQTRNTIATLVDSGLLTDEVADTWKATVKKLDAEKDEVENLFNAVKNNCPWAQFRLGQLYETGSPYGTVKKNIAGALHHYEFSAWAGCREGAKAALKFLLAHDVGPRREPKALAMAHTAAALNSARACAQLAYWCKDGQNYMVQNDKAATFWFKKMLRLELGNNPSFETSLEERQEAEAWLAAHP